MKTDRMISRGLCLKGSHRSAKATDTHQALSLRTSLPSKEYIGALSFILLSESLKRDSQLLKRTWSCRREYQCHEKTWNMITKWVYWPLNELGLESRKNPQDQMIIFVFWGPKHTQCELYRHGYQLHLSMQAQFCM